MKIDFDQIPGTVHLVDLEGTMSAQHKKDIVLVPTPSSDPDDPLNWSKRRKFLSLFSMVVYAMGVGVASAAIYSILLPITESNKALTLSSLNQGTGVMFLFFGVGCWVMQPLALQYGKRPVYLFSMLATALIMVWAPYTKSNGEWIGSKLLQGLFGAPIESLCEISISDLFFEHERGTYMSVYAFFLPFSNFIAPLVAGFISDGQGWEWVMYWTAIYCAVSFVALFFLMEETNYSRGSITENPIEEHSGGSMLEADGEGIEKKQTNIHSVDIENGSIQHYTPKTYRQKLKLLDKPRPFMLWKLMWRSITMFRFPAIIWSGFAYGASLVWFNVLNATSSLILSEQYGFSAAMVGLTYIAPIIGCGITCLYIGPLGDWIKINIARKHNGISEPEDRLWLYAPYMLICPAGLLLWGVAAAHQTPWIVPVIGMGLLGFSSVIGVAASANYCVDCYRELAGDGMPTVIVIRNLMSFAIGYGITPWIDGMGIQNCFICAACISIACISTFLIMIKWGKHWRQSTNQAYWTYVEDALAHGMVH